jgi:hypothetical protein
VIDDVDGSLKFFGFVALLPSGFCFGGLPALYFDLIASSSIHFRDRLSRSSVQKMLI